MWDAAKYCGCLIEGIMGSENESFNLEDLPKFLNSVLEKAEFICREENVDLSTVETHLVVVDRALGLLRKLSLRDDIACIDGNDLEHLNSLSYVFAEPIVSAMKQLVSARSFTPTTVAENCCSVR